jgi:holliday junction DNA helicase RuvA
MYEYLDGNISYKRYDYFVVDVHGVGYKVFCSQPMLSRIPDVGQRIRIYTYLVVREDVMAIYGFTSTEELSMFELLLTVSGIGPKVAGLITASIEPSSFAIAVLSSDISLISSVKGIGKKGAERIILELKDKLEKNSQGSELLNQSSNKGTSSQKEDKYLESCHALAVLGYSQTEASRAVNKVYSSEKPIEEIIKSALKEFK